MKITKITSINSYKSYSDFSWNKFCKNGSGHEETLQKFSIFFGENGSGKSAVCDILKSLSQIQDFQNDPPKLAQVEINDGSNNQIHKYENGNWTNQVGKNVFLFFDVDFVNANVHTHGIRSSNLQQGAHTQKAGKLIIDLDEQANNLKEEVETKKVELEVLQKSCSNILDKQFTDKDQEFFQTYKDTDEKAKKEKLAKTQDELKKLEADLSTLQKQNNKYSEICKLASVSKVIFSASLSSKETYTELFTRQIKEKAQDETDAKIKAHFEKHKQFIESAKDQIPQNYKNDNCPLCMQPLANASKVIEYYRTAFDQTYKNAKLKFLSDIQTTKSELESLKLYLSLLPEKVTVVFDDFEKIKTDFEIPDIYKLEEKKEYAKKFRDLSLASLDELLTALESQKSIDQKQVDVAKIYDAIVKGLTEVEKAVENLNKLVAVNNKSITDFKSKYSDQSKITSEIQEMSQKETVLRDTVDYLKSEKIELIKNQNETITKQKSLAEKLKSAQEELKKYLANTIPVSVINKMVAILGKFNLNFKLEHITPDSKTKDYSFSFKIKDQKDYEREFKSGLSEGERQLISIAFFFSINDKVSDKQKKVLIFDDPITSLDAPNLKILAELIHQKTQEFSQVVVFTHHPLFFKYLVKSEKPSPYKFGVLKNTDTFGGSFIFCDPGFDLTKEIQKCNEEISENAKKGNLKPEEIALKYGQLLRLAVEKFIKNDLLMWNKERNFEKDIISNLSSSKSKIRKLHDDDIGILMNIYKYCNYSNLLHADKETPSALSELTNHIIKFNSILNKVTN